MTAWEITIVFESDRDTAERLLEDVSDAACAATGGRGNGNEHFCGGFASARLGEFGAE